MKFYEKCITETNYIEKKLTVVLAYFNLILAFALSHLW